MMAGPTTPRVDWGVSVRVIEGRADGNDEKTTS